MLPIIFNERPKNNSFVLIELTYSEDGKNTEKIPLSMLLLKQYSFIANKSRGKISEDWLSGNAVKYYRAVYFNTDTDKMYEKPIYISKTGKLFSELSYEGKKIKVFLDEFKGGSFEDYSSADKILTEELIDTVLLYSNLLSEKAQDFVDKKFINSSMTATEIGFDMISHEVVVTLRYKSGKGRAMTKRFPFALLCATP